jgi:hypothetical protein
MVAAAILKINATFWVGHLSLDFDEILYTNQEEHAESKKTFSAYGQKTANIKT